MKDILYLMSPMLLLLLSLFTGGGKIGSYEFSGISSAVGLVIFSLAIITYIKQLVEFNKQN